MPIIGTTNSCKMPCESLLAGGCQARTMAHTGFGIFEDIPSIGGTTVSPPPRHPAALAYSLSSTQSSRSSSSLIRMASRDTPNR